MSSSAGAPFQPSKARSLRCAAEEISGDRFQMRPILSFEQRGQLAVAVLLAVATLGWHSRHLEEARRSKGSRIRTDDGHVRAVGFEVPATTRCSVRRYADAPASAMLIGSKR